MAAPVGTKFIVGVTGAAAAITGAALWNADYGAAESLRGRDPGISVEKILHYVGDLPELVDLTFVNRPSTPAEIAAMADYETPLGRTPEQLLIAFAGLGTFFFARSKM